MNTITIKLEKVGLESQKLLPAIFLWFLIILPPMLAQDAAHVLEDGLGPLACRRKWTRLSRPA